MFSRPVPKRTALIIASVIFAIIYTLCFIACVALKKTNSGLLSGDINNSPPQSDTSSVLSGTSSEVNSSESLTSDVNGNVSSNVSTGSDGTTSSNSASSDIASSDTSSTNSSTVSSTTSSTTPPPTPVVPSGGDFGGAIWISIYDMADEGLQGMNESQFRTMVNKMFDNAKGLGLDSVICHVRPNSDAIYNSKYFPYCRTLTGTEGVDPGYDPLKIMISLAHAKGLKIHAWVNPYRINTTTTSLNKLSADNPAKIYLTDGNSANDRYVLKATDPAGRTGLYYNPAVSEVRQLIVNGIKEICQNYDVDGIHIDDYFYPTTASSFDDIEYAKYKVTAGSNAMSLANWRKENVNTLVRDIYSAVKSYGITFGISPAANIDRCNNELYADVAKWISTPGYTDYIMPQIYYGYKYPTSKYSYPALLNQWMSLPRLSTVEIHIGLGNYKIDTTDAGSTEWKTNTDIIARQTKDAHDMNADGVVLFSYGAVFGNSTNQKAQTANFRQVFNGLK